MKQFLKLYENFGEETPMEPDMTPTPRELNIENETYNDDDFQSDEWPEQDSNQMQYLNALSNMTADQIREQYLEGNLNSATRKKIAAQVLGDIVASGEYSQEDKELFHLLSGTMLET